MSQNQGRGGGGISEEEAQAHLAQAEFIKSQKVSLEKEDAMKAQEHSMLFHETRVDMEAKLWASLVEAKKQLRGVDPDDEDEREAYAKRVRRLEQQYAVHEGTE